MKKSTQWEVNMIDLKIKILNFYCEATKECGPIHLPPGYQHCVNKASFHTISVYTHWERVQTREDTMMSLLCCYHDYIIGLVQEIWYFSLFPLIVVHKNTKTKHKTGL